MRRNRHKYHAVRTEVHGQKFDSKAEARYFGELKLRQKAGEVVFFLRQVPFHLPGNVVYRCDFQEFLSVGSVRFVDVKGAVTQLFTMKKKQVETLYPITIEVVK